MTAYPELGRVRSPLAYTRRSLACALTLALSACATAPAVGPPASQVVGAGSQDAEAPYLVVKVTPQVLAVLAAQKPADLASTFSDRSPPPMQTIGVGDTVSVTVWDMSGLLAGGGAPSTTAGGIPLQGVQSGGGTLPPQAVDPSGAVAVPYAGRVRIAGMSPGAAEQAIATALRGKALQPQVLVSVGASQASVVTVAGDVARPGRVPLAPTGTRLLDAVALSGGSTAPAVDTSIQLTRDAVTRRVRLASVVSDPGENIYLRPDDLLFLNREPRSVVVLGATNRNAEIPFAKSSLTLAEAMGGGGGLTDSQADPYGVFVFRYEPGTVARALQPSAADGGPVAVVYQIDFNRPSGVFMAQAFDMRDRDVVYVANKPVVQLNKLVRTLLGVSSIFNRGALVAN